MKRVWNLSQSSKSFKRLLKLISLLYLSTGQVWWLNELWFKRYIQKCTLSHVLILIMTSKIWLSHGMVKNTKTWISWELNTTFLKSKKIFNLCLRLNILGSLFEIQFHSLHAPMHKEKNDKSVLEIIFPGSLKRSFWEKQVQS